MVKLNDSVGKSFIEFFEQQGVQFVDMETGKPITSGNEPYKERSVCGNDVNIGEK